LLWRDFGVRRHRCTSGGQYRQPLERRSFAAKNSGPKSDERHKTRKRKKKNGKTFPQNFHFEKTSYRFEKTNEI